MSGHRQAAIALYGVDAADQEAILENLPAEDQAILRQYLNELKELGFASTDSALAVAGAQLSAEFITSEKTLAGGASGTSGTSSAQLQLQQMRAACVYEVLAHEPASLIAQFLAFDHWPWAADFLDMFTPSRRTLIVAAMDRERPRATKCQQYLLDEVLLRAKRVARTQQAQSMPAPSGIGRAFAKLKQRIGAWTR